MRKIMGIIGGLVGIALMGGTAFASSGPTSGALTAQPEGTLTIQYMSSGAHQGEYAATWNWTAPAPGLQPNQEVMLVGDAGTSVSLSKTPETLVFGTAAPSGGTATLYIPSTDYFASKANPETFEIFALFSSTPVGQMPEAPYAAGLPLAGVALAGFTLYRRGLAR